MQHYTHGSLVIRSLELGELATQCYILTDFNTYETILVDPADSAETILTVVQANKLKPVSILLTHGHFDHVLGLLELQLALDLPVFMHPADSQLLKSAQSSAVHWLNHPVDPVPQKTETITDGSELAFGSHSLHVLHTPGHTPGSCSFVLKDQSQIVLGILTGDTLFKNSVGRTDFSYSKPLQLRDSLHKLMEYSSNVPCYPGHGEPTTIAEAQEFLS